MTFKKIVLFEPTFEKEKYYFVLDKYTQLTVALTFLYMCKIKGLRKK